MNLFIGYRVRFLQSIFKFIKNPFELILFRLNIIKEYECKFKNHNETILIKNDEKIMGLTCIFILSELSKEFDVDIEGFVNFWKQNLDGIISIGSVKYRNTGLNVLTHIIESFFANMYPVDEIRGGEYPL